MNVTIVCGGIMLFMRRSLTACNVMKAEGALAYHAHLQLHLLWSKARILGLKVSTSQCDWGALGTPIYRYIHFLSFLVFILSSCTSSCRICFVRTSYNKVPRQATGTNITQAINLNLVVCELHHIISQGCTTLNMQASHFHATSFSSATLGVSNSY